MISFSLVISKSLSTFLTKIDQTHPFPVSHKNGFAPSGKLQPCATKPYDQMFLSNSFGRRTRFKASMSFSNSEEMQSRVQESQRIRRTGEPSLFNSFSLNLRQSRLSLLPTNVDRTDPLSISGQKIPTDSNDFSLIAFSGTSTQTTAKDPMASEGSEARFGRTYASVGGTVGGFLAVIVAVTLAIGIHRNGMRSEVIEEEGESGADIDAMETIASFEASHHYVSQENTDQAQTDELIRLSVMIE
jgi:hypothetical protein